MGTDALVVRAIHARQGDHDIYSFFIRGPQLLKIAKISRIAPDEKGGLSGFQRKPVQDQVRAIAEYVSRGDVLFPNAIVLALSSNVKYVATRGPTPRGSNDTGEAGTLTIPAAQGTAAAWIVDGQQRALALAESRAEHLLVPVVAFVSEAVATQREQFILVNKARPLSRRLIDELLPEVDFPLPRDLSARKTPSYLCGVLNDHPDSPFHGLIRRASTVGDGAVVTDSSLVRAIRNSIAHPRGALAAHVTPDGKTDMAAAFQTLVTFWGAVRDVFPDAWGLPADRSRLMHSAGIEAMGVLMDQIMGRLASTDNALKVRTSLERIALECRWTHGRWATIDREWNDIQSTPHDVRLLANLLVSLDRGALVEQR